MIDRDHRYYIRTQKKYKAYQRKKRRPLWIIILGSIGALSAGVTITLQGREIPAHPERSLARLDHSTLNASPNTSPFPHQPPIPITKKKATAQRVKRITDGQSFWKNITIKQGDSLARIFSRVGLSPRQLDEVMSLGKPVQPLAHIQPGQLLQIAFKKNTAQRQLAALRLNLNEVEYLEVHAKGEGFEAKHVSRETKAHITIVAGTIKSSLFEDGLQAGLTHKQVMKLTQIFGRDINFALDLRAGDSFQVAFKEYYLHGKKVKNGPILAAEFTNQGETHRAIRYTYGDHHPGYYTPKGASLRRAFLRTPVTYSRVSSPFNLHREHPVLHYSRPHEGVDLAAPMGTPVKASGKGKVIFIGHKGGYGKAIVLKHGPKYTTLYGHLSRFENGLEEGSEVTRGETIGYVGQTGLATGPHLHYEFRINGVPRAPLKVELPRANPIPANYKQDFLDRAAGLIARLDTAEATTVALSQ